MDRQFTLSLREDTRKEEDTFRMAILGHTKVGKSTVSCRLVNLWTTLSRQTKEKGRKGRKGRKGCSDLGIKGRSLTVNFVDIAVNTVCPFLQPLPSCDAYVLVYSLVCDESYEAVVAAKDHIIQQEGSSVPIVFVANKKDIADSVDQTQRMYQHLNINCEWENGHMEISAEMDDTVMPVLEQIMKRHQKYVSEKKRASRVSKTFPSVRNLFSRN
ncbi:ras-like protein family member 10B [Haliotis asinina]|uniref:ras-like protein family member 10B n=1 Tax=Haliotis asinina TaxID=109174 RepID=UPI003531B22F